MTASEAAAGLMERTEARRQAASKQLGGKTRVALGQFFTPVPVADFIASLIRLPEHGVVRLLDPGAGTGSLTAAVVGRAIREHRQVSLEITACEVDENLHEPLIATLRDCERTAAEAGLEVQVRLLTVDFIEWAAGQCLFTPERHDFDLVVMNPPYRKLNRNSRERRLVASAGVEVSNLYSAFLALAATALSPNGQVAAITPRSFTNGPYFRDFRRFFLDLMRLDVLHVFESRSAVFADSGVLQENLVFLATRSDAESRPPVVISTSTGYHDTPQKRIVPYTEVVRPHDPERFIHITVHEQDAELTHILDALPNTLTDLDIQVSTGRVVDFRVKEHLRAEPGDSDIPLIYPLHMKDGRVRWPVPDAKKPNGLAFNQATAKLALPSGHYVIVKRMSSKEERRRVVAALFDPSDVICNAVGFENHVNVFHCNNTGLPADLANGLCLWLNSTIVDRLIRQFNGHTQINATDLRMLRYPTVTELRELGAAWGAGDWPGQEKIDNLVSQHVSACKDSA